MRSFSLPLCVSTSVPFPADKPATRLFPNLQILSIIYLICRFLCFVSGTHGIFPGLVKTQLAVAVVNSTRLPQDE